MSRETCCGAVVFTRRDGRIRYVLVRSRKGEYGFPKGHMEPGETERETALREIWEEVRLRPVLLDGFRTVTAYTLPQKPGTVKQVVYFLAEYAGQEIEIQPEELQSAVLATYEEAMTLLGHADRRRVLQEAREFLPDRLAKEK